MLLNWINIEKIEKIEKKYCPLWKKILWPLTPIWFLVYYLWKGWSILEFFSKDRDFHEYMIAFLFLNVILTFNPDVQECSYHKTLWGLEHDNPFSLALILFRQGDSKLSNFSTPLVFDTLLTISHHLCLK